MKTELQNIGTLKQMGKLLLFPVIAIFIISFAEKNRNRALIEDVKLEWPADEKAFLSDRDLIQRLNAAFPPALDSLKVNELKLDRVEEVLAEDAFIHEADAFCNLQGQLFIRIEQEKPLVRIINKENQSFYINEQGLKMRLSELHTARVLVATGHIEEKDYDGDSLKTQTAQNLYLVAKYLNERPFFKSLAGQFTVEANGDIVMITKAEERHDVIIGDAERLDEKFDLLEQFYTKVLNAQGWDKYRTINLKYKNQVVAKKN